MASRETRSLPADALLLAGGRVFDPQSRIDEAADVLVAEGKIRKIGADLSKGFEGKRIECANMVLVPGLMDMHVHLREPGREDEETIESGVLAAAAGGFTEIACMPNTQPPIDDRSRVEFVRERAAGQIVSVHPIAAVTKGQKGEELTEMGDCVEAGAVGFSDDGLPVENAAVLRKALEYAGMFGRPILSHCEDKRLSENGVMHEGFVSTLLGLRGIPSISESVAVARDLLIAEFTGGRLHVAHVSTAGSVRLIREAKSRGVRVTAETCPHYLTLTDEAVRGYDANMKMNPPLRTGADQQALWEGLKDGTLDAIATDHAPHSAEEKDAEFDAAPFGILGLETAVGLLFTFGVHKKKLSLGDLVQKMAVAPRKILNLPEARIRVGSEANLTLLFPDFSWTVDKERFFSKSRNTPFHGWKLKGASRGVVHNGRSFFPDHTQSRTEDSR
jgi:dihydroorotase